MREYNRLQSEESGHSIYINNPDKKYYNNQSEKVQINILSFAVALLIISAILIVYFTTIMANKTSDTSKTDLALVTKLSSGNVEFTKNLYDIVRREPGNIFVSPLSLELALILAYNGASGNTSKEIGKALGLPEGKKDSLSSAEAIIKLFRDTTNVTLNIANGIFLHDNYKVKQGYVDSSKKYLSAEAQKVNFGKSQEAAKTINGFVDQHTNHKITELFASDSFDDMTKVVLVNAVYFFGNWSKQFKTERTYEGDFHLNETETKKVQFMTQTTHLEYDENEKLNATIVKIPYAGNDVSMVIVVPKEINGLAELENKIKEEDLGKLASKENLRRREIEIHMPKFKLEQTLNLESVLNELGMSSMLTPGKADFQDLTDDNNLYVQKVIQKAYIDVNEQGTEAAAATAGVVRKKRSLEVFDFTRVHVDRPFVFSIIWEGFVLFIGSLRNGDCFHQETLFQRSGNPTLHEEL